MHTGDNIRIQLRDIEAVLVSYPKVLEAASFGEADAMYRENVQAAVVLRPGTSATGERAPRLLSCATKRV